MELSDAQLVRYSRQIMLPGFDLGAQATLLASRVLVLGLGGLGCPAAMYLAASGVGSLILADPDRVELSNLQRQIAHGDADLGVHKVESAAATLRALNPEVRVETVVDRLGGGPLESLVARVDLVLDATDNFAARFAANEVCWRHGVPLVHASAVRFEAQLTVFDARSPASPCYRCLYQDETELEESCALNGVLAPLVGLVGAAQALEAIKVLTAVGEPLVGRLMMLDARRAEWRQLALAPRPGCPVCGKARSGAD